MFEHTDSDRAARDFVRESMEPKGSSAPLIIPSFLEKELQWLQECILLRIEETEQPTFSSALPTPPNAQFGKDHYSEFLVANSLSQKDRLLLVTALAPMVSPELFNLSLIDPQNRLFPRFKSFGGLVDKVFFNFIPTFQTFLYLLAGDDAQARTSALMVSQESMLRQKQMIELASLPASPDSMNPLNQVIRVANEYLRFFLGGTKPRPDFGDDFPATLVETSLDWDDLILAPETFRQIDRLKKWLYHGKELVEKGEGKFNESFPVLFYGSPGTGKTLTAMLLGKSFNRDVFRIDLSMVVSKYIGETEKNLARLFDRAEGKDWILFFDEADALFGKRTQVSDAHDKWANLEVSYLLQRLETYSGLTILASNIKDNLDSALTRRFQAMIQFSRPGSEELLSLWKRLLPSAFSYDESIDFAPFDKYKLTGANISNVLKYACLEAVEQETTIISREMVRLALRDELSKENRTV